MNVATKTKSSEDTSTTMEVGTEKRSKNNTLQNDADSDVENDLREHTTKIDKISNQGKAKIEHRNTTKDNEILK